MCRSFGFAMVIVLAPVLSAAEPGHWAFRTPVRPAMPTPQNPAWVRNPVDAFLAAEWEKRGLTPAAPADARLLLRRVYLDLIGLPPTAEETSAFLNNNSPNAYETVVDRLLASPQYGERWGRHWMDVWRYSDWWGLGAEVRNSQKHIWHWRDWIIESLNQDKGYDEMIHEMLAADELYPDDLDRLRATGFLVRHYFIFNRNTWLEETVEHTAKAFLGLTINCCKCHEHKYDPFGQEDFFRFRAFFEPYQVRLEMLPGETDYAKNALPRVFDCNLDTPTYLFAKGDEKRPEKDKPILPQLPAVLQFDDLKITPVRLSSTAQHPGLRPHVLSLHLRQTEQQLSAAKQALEVVRQKLAASEKAASKSQPLAAQIAIALARGELAVAERAFAVADLQRALWQVRATADRARFAQPPAADAANWAQTAARLERHAAVLKADEDLARAEFELFKTPAVKKNEARKRLASAREAQAKAKKALESPGDNYTSIHGALKTPESNIESEASRRKPFPATSTGRRSALARWITDPRNPLTARVAVNHIWLRHFGQPLVATVFDFGKKGAQPTHPELLDWLAVELRDNGWSMKHLHRLIVTSYAYRLSGSSLSAERSRAVDPENRWCWRRNSMRMEAQIIRDSLLHLSGDLDPAMGGPSIPVQQEHARRRSLYFVHSHNDHQKFLSLFDDAPVLECYRRSESIVPQQALALANSQFALTAAGKINQRLHDRLGNVSDTEFVRAAFRGLLGSEPTREEMETCLQALAEFRAAAPGAGDMVRRARRDLVHALINHNDFVTIR